MTTYEIVELLLFSLVIIYKYGNRRIEKLDEELESMGRKLDGIELCHEKHRKKIRKSSPKS